MSGLYDPYGKKIDESWKDRVEKERREAPSPGPSPRSGPAADGPHGKGMPPADFGLFLSSLSMQAMVALGEMPHPATQEREPDLDQARYLIDVLGLLQEKTRGNLTAEEVQVLEGLLYELRMKYVSHLQGGAPA